MSDPGRYRLHSAVNDAPYWFVLLVFCFSLVISVIWLPLALWRGEVQPVLVIAPFKAIAFFCALWWGRRLLVRVYVRPDGLELGLAKRLVPWASLQAVQNLSAFGGLLLPLYRLTFRDGTAPVMFYACDDVEAVIGRYRAPVERADASGSEPHA